MPGYNGDFVMTIQDIAGKYYEGNQSGDTSWDVKLNLAQTFLKTLPRDWDKVSISWSRHPDYLGVFRSGTDSKSYVFSYDARAIIKYLYKAKRLRAYGLLTIYQWNEQTFNYDVFYPCVLDFKVYRDITQFELLEIGTLDSGLFRDVQAYGNTVFNKSIWQKTSGVWTTVPNVKFLIHDGIKLLYNAAYESSAKDVDPLFVTMQGYNQGRHGFAFPNNGHHTIPALVPFNVTQNNGTTTFIGNDILAQLIKQQQQVPGLAGQEIDFSGANNSQPYVKNNNAIKSLLLNPIDVSVVVSYAFANTSTINYIDNGNGCFIGLVLFEIDQDDNPIISSSRYQYTMIDSFSLPGASGGGVITPPYTPMGNISSPVTISLNPAKVYIFGLVYDEATAGGLDNTKQVSFYFSDLRFSILSKYDYGNSGTPIAAPTLNASVFPGMRIVDLLKAIVPMLATTNTDSNGFPIPVSTAYAGASNFLSDPALAAQGDVIPYNILMTSAYCIHDLQGQSYISISLNQIFKFCKNVLGCAAAIEGDTFRIEDLAYFFDSSTIILDLGYDIEDLEIIPMTTGLGANLKLGYSKADTNSDFGVDAFATELFFNTPLAEIPGTMDYEETDILTEMYAIEKIRAQRVSQPTGSTFDPANPSTDNRTVAFYCLPTPTQWLPQPTNPVYNFQPYDPDNNPIFIGTPTSPEVYQLTQRNGVNLPAAQNTDPTAASAPYINGLYYPDSAINVELSPCRALQRGAGAYLHSVLDKMDSEYLAFRNTYVMQFNNQTLALTGIESNLRVGAGASVIKEFSDKKIGDLPTQLFQPVILKFKSKYPVNMYQSINTNPRGCITFKVKQKGYGDKVYKCFINRVRQVGNLSPTEFEGWATLDSETD